TNVYGIEPATAGVGNLGFVGVFIFFLISGFIITSLTLAEQKATGTFSQSDFFIRRCLRILPPLFLYLAAMAALRFNPNIARAAIFTCNIGIGHGCLWTFGHT